MVGVMGQELDRFLGELGRDYPPTNGTAAAASLAKDVKLGIEDLVLRLGDKILITYIFPKAVCLICYIQGCSSSSSGPLSRLF